MGLPGGTFTYPASGWLQVVFSGQWTVDDADWTSGDWDIVLRCYVGSGADRRTATISLHNPTAMLTVAYTGGTEVPVGMEYMAHSFGGAGAVAARSLVCACYVLLPATSWWPEVDFGALLGQMIDERAPAVAAPAAPPWALDASGAQWYVRPMIDLATVDIGPVEGNLNPVGRRTLYCSAQPDTESVEAFAGDPDDEEAPWVRLDAQVYYNEDHDIDPEAPPWYIKIGTAKPYASYTASWRQVPAGTYDGMSYATAWAGFAAIPWSSISPGDTLWVCDLHRNQVLEVGASGIAGAYVKIRLDHPTYPGEIRQSELIDADRWTLEPSGEYSMPMRTPRNAVFEDGVRMFGCGVTSKSRVKVTSTNPATDIIEFSTRKRCATGKLVPIPHDFTEPLLPAGLEFNYPYALIVISETEVGNNWNYVCQLALSPADAAAGIPVDITGTSDRWYLWLTDTGYPYYDPVPGALAPGRFGYDAQLERLHYRPTAGSPGSHVIEISNDKNAVEGAAVRIVGRSYVRVLGGGEYGGMFGVLCAGRISQCHVNAVDVTDGSNVVVDGVEVDGARSGISFKGTMHACARNNWVRNVGWHGVGGEGGAHPTPETDLIVERNWIDGVALQHDWGDAQGCVLNAANHRGHIRRNLIQRVGRNVAKLNTGAAVMDATQPGQVYWNWFDDCVGEVVEVGSGTTAGGNIDSRIVGNVCTRSGQRMGGYLTHQPARVGFAVITMSNNEYGRPLLMGAVAGNLVADCTFRPEPSTPLNTGGVFYARSATEVNAMVFGSIVRNAVLSADAAVFAIARTGSSLWPLVEYSDNNLYASTPDFAYMQSGATKTATWSGGQIKGDGAGYWSFDTGHDARSRLAVRSLGDPGAEPTAERLDAFLRGGAAQDSYDTTHRPGLHCVGRFPMLAI